MKSVQKQSRTKVPLLAVARLFVASIVTASFLLTVAPLGTATTAASGPMDCCVGKLGNVPGSCDSGLLGSADKSQSAPSTSLDHHPASTSEFSLTVVAGVSEGEHCYTPSAGTQTSTNTALADPEASLTTDEFESDPLTVEATAVPTAQPGLPSFDTVSQPCAENCCACSTSISRRPREQSTLSFAARPQTPSVRTPSSSNHSQMRPLNRQWLHLRPRAPPK